MHVHHNWDHEINLGGGDLGLNNKELTFDACFALFP